MAQNKKSKWYSITSIANEGSKIVSINIFGEIGWDITAQEFINDLAALGDVDQVDVEIGSVGGNVWDGLSIYNALLNHPATVKVLITSLAASMASVIAQAASPGNLTMMAQSMQMIHNPATGAWGDQHDHQKTADILAKIREALVGAYMRRFTGTEEELIALLDDETWLTTTDCLANGLADESIDQEMDIAACLKDVNLSSFANVPKEFLAIANNDQAGDVATATERAELVSEIISRHNQSAAADETIEGLQMTPEEIAAAAKAAREVEAKRQGDIRGSFSNFDFDGIAALMDTCVNDLDCTIEMANAKLLEAMGKDVTPVGSPAVVTEDARDKYKAGAEKAISMRIGAEKVDHANEFLSMSLLEICKKDANVRNVSLTGKDKYQIVAVALQPGSDFPGILENVATKEALRGYDEKEEVYTQLARIGNLPDFKTANRSGLGHAPSLTSNAELQEIETIEFADRKQDIQLATYAGKAGLSRQAIINDDLNQFGLMMQRLGAGAKRTVGDRFSNVFTQNANGQLIDEGNARIFDAARNNTGTAGVPTTASFTEFRTLMGVQQDVGGNANLNISPSLIYCPVALEGQALVVVQAENEVTTAKTSRMPNVERSRWTVVTDARLDASSATRYYGLGAPNVYDTVEVAFLDGRDTPMIERIDTYDVLGVNWVIWIDCVAQALDYRAMAVNDGV